MTPAAAGGYRPRSASRRRRLARLAAWVGAAVALAVAPGCALDQTTADLELLELDAPALAAELAAGRVSAERVTRAVLARIAAIDAAGPRLNAIIEVNPDALAIARELDGRFATGGAVGPLHGMPVVLKANIDTADRLASSAGSLALAAHHAAADAPLVARLREAGAVIVGKANLSEWANFRSTRSSSGWSSLGGQTLNPYVLDRNPCGSSSGSAVAVAARLVPLAVGTETDGSIVCPAGANGVVGIKPTQGLVSRAGIIPISATQDTAGPLARTVRGAALLLAAMQAAPSAPGAYAVERADLTGLRIGVVRDYFGAGSEPAVADAYARWLALLEGAGAELVDPIENVLPEGADAAELTVLLYEFKDGLNEYLQAAGAEPGSLSELIDYNAAHADTVMPYFGQELFVMAEQRGDLSELEYAEALRASHAAVRAELEALFEERDLDALVAPVNSPAWKTDWVSGDDFSLSSSSIAAISGYPNVAVPGSLVSGLPIGIAFVGEPESEPLLIEIAAVFETLRGPFPAPAFIPTLEAGAAP